MKHPRRTPQDRAECLAGPATTPRQRRHPNGCGPGRLRARSPRALSLSHAESLTPEPDRQVRDQRSAPALVRSLPTRLAPAQASSDPPGHTPPFGSAPDLEPSTPLRTNTPAREPSLPLPLAPPAQTVRSLSIWRPSHDHLSSDHRRGSSVTTSAGSSSRGSSQVPDDMPEPSRALPGGSCRWCRAPARARARCPTFGRAAVARSERWGRRRPASGERRRRLTARALPAWRWLSRWRRCWERHPRACERLRACRLPVVVLHHTPGRQVGRESRLRGVACAVARS